LSELDAIDDRSQEVGMRTTIMLDDKLVEDAQHYTGISETSELLSEALRALIQREVSRRMILLGGSDPTAAAGPRRRSNPSS
jgi:Arc/MetJ family transcription regulator